MNSTLGPSSFLNFDVLSAPVSFLALQFLRPGKNVPYLNHGKSLSPAPTPSSVVTQPFSPQRAGPVADFSVNTGSLERAG